MPIRHAIFILAAILLLAVPGNVPGDWAYFWQAGRAVIDGQNPYATVSGFYSPVHTLIYFVPLSLLSFSLSAKLNAIINAAVIVIACWKFSGGSLRLVALALIFPWPLLVVTNGNIEWTALLAALINPVLGVFLALAKPNISVVLLVLLLWTLWRKDKRIGIIMGLTATTIMALTFALGANWSSLANQRVSWNFSLWPVGLLICLPLLISVVKNRRRDHALAASLFVTPYANPYASIIVLPLIVRLRWWIVLGLLILSWLFVYAYHNGLI